jgi:hypothetical protein
MTDGRKNAVRFFVLGLMMAGLAAPMASFAQVQHHMQGKPEAPKATTKPTGTWAPKNSAFIKASNTSKDDAFGYAVALSGDGNTLAVGATNEDSAAKGVNGVNGDQKDTSMEGAGAVYIFARSGAAWAQQAYLKASNTGGPDVGYQFGYSVSLSSDGSTLAVGSTSEPSGIGDQRE